MLYYFIFVMMPIRAAKQRRSESRSRAAGGAMSGGAEAAEERNRRAAQRAERWRGGASDERGSGSERSIHPPSIPDIIRRATIHNIHTIRVRDIARIDIGRLANILLK